LISLIDSPAPGSPPLLIFLDLLNSPSVSHGNGRAKLRSLESGTDSLIQERTQEADLRSFREAELGGIVASKQQKKRIGKTNKPKLTAKEKQERKTRDKDVLLHAAGSANRAAALREPVRAKLAAARTGAGKRAG
jgi:hypothetical protein